MVWSKHDFEREVRRQLVELEAIRKRLPVDSEVHRRLDQLEASHRQLLRKLGDVFKAAKRSKGSVPVNAGVLEDYLRTTAKASSRLHRLLGPRSNRRRVAAGGDPLSEPGLN